MNVARPADGFRIRVAPNVQQFVDALLPDHPELQVHWRALIKRMKDTAHLEGGPAAADRSRRLGTVVLGGYRFKLAWTVLGDTVTILFADF